MIMMMNDDNEYDDDDMEEEGEEEDGDCTFILLTRVYRIVSLSYIKGMEFMHWLIECNWAHCLSVTCIDIPIWVELMYLSANILIKKTAWIGLIIGFFGCGKSHWLAS